MKVQGFMFAMIVDQVGSRSGPDLVPLALAALSRLDLVLPFERTAGDELQGLTDDPAAVVADRLERLPIRVPHSSRDFH